MRNIVRIILILTKGFVSISKSVFSEETIVLSQTIRGQVVDKETQTTFLGVNAIILNTDPLKATITDIDGDFLIDNVPVGRHNIKVSYVGYQSYLIDRF